MCCRGKSRGRTGICDRGREREKRKIDRKRDSLTAVPLGTQVFSSGFFLILFFLLTPPLYFSESRPICFLWALAPGPLSLPRHSSCTFPGSLEVYGPDSPSSLWVSVSPNHSHTLTYLWATLPRGFSHQLLIVQFTLLQQIQDVLLLNTNQRYSMIR